MASEWDREASFAQDAALKSHVERLTRERDDYRGRLGEVMFALDEFAAFPSREARDAANAWLTIDTCIPLHEAVSNMQQVLCRENRRAETAERERDEARALLSPEVQAAAEYLKRNADAHPHACCAKCAMAMTERDEARAEIANLQRGIEAYRTEHHYGHPDYHFDIFPRCQVCAWERKQREESDNETEPPRNLPDSARRRRLNTIHHSCYNDDRQHI